MCPEAILQVTQGHTVGRRSCTYAAGDSHVKTENKIYQKNELLKMKHQHRLLICLFVLGLGVVFRDRFSVCSHGCPVTHSVGQPGLELTEIHLS